MHHAVLNATQAAYDLALDLAVATADPLIAAATAAGAATIKYDVTTKLVAEQGGLAQAMLGIIKGT